MSYTVELKLKPETYQQFQNIHTKLNNNDREPQSKYLGDNISNIACELIDQAFGARADAGELAELILTDRDSAIENLSKIHQ